MSASRACAAEVRFDLAQAVTNSTPDINVQRRMAVIASDLLCHTQVRNSPNTEARDAVHSTGFCFLYHLCMIKLTVRGGQPPGGGQDSTLELAALGIPISFAFLGYIL